MSSYPPKSQASTIPDAPPIRQRAQPPAVPARGEMPAVTERVVDEGWGLDAIGYWAVGCALWLFLLSLPLLLFPRLLLFLSQTSSTPASYSTAFASKKADDHYDDLSNLEAFMCGQMGVGLLAVGMLSLLLTPTPSPPPTFPPLQEHTSLPAPSPSTTSGSHLRMGFLLILSAMSGVSALLGFNGGRGLSTAGLSTFVAIGNTVISLWGFWVFAFGLGDVYRSKKTGADKRTSQFPFYNKNAAGVQKREWKKTH